MKTVQRFIPFTTWIESQNMDVYTFFFPPFYLQFRGYTHSVEWIRLKFHSRKKILVKRDGSKKKAHRDEQRVAAAEKLQSNGDREFPVLWYRQKREHNHHDSRMRLQGGFQSILGNKRWYLFFRVQVPRFWVFEHSHQCFELCSQIREVICRPQSRWSVSVGICASLNLETHTLKEL